MKRVTILIMGMLLIGIVTSGLLSTKTDVTINTHEKTNITRVKGNVTFTINGKSTGYCYIDEPNDDIGDDVEECLKKDFPDKTITEIEDWNNRKYQQLNVNGKVYRDFNSSKLDSINTTIQGL